MKAFAVASQLALVASLCAADGAWAQGQKEVLVLYATRRDAQLVSIGDRELPRILTDGLPEGVDYYSEFLDMARFADEEYGDAFREFLALKYRARQFDVVIAIGEVPLRFLITHRDALFAETPLVYFTERRIAPPVNATGVVAELNLAGTVSFATELQPDTRNVFVVIGAPPSNALYRRAAREQLGAFEPGLAITYLEGLRTDALEARLRALPAHSIVYYLAVDRDGAGELFNPLEYLDRVTAAANAPVYCWVSPAMDHGIVGGSLKDQLAQTRAVGNLALRVLRGEKADSIPPATADLNVRQVDWRQLRRWGIAESRVPAGTVVMFRSPSLWDRYRGYLLTVAALLAAQTALITGLLVQRLRRRQAEAQVHKNQGELRQSYDRIRDLASRLLNAQEAERARIARELHDDISQQMALLQIELEQLVGVVKGQAHGLTHEALQRTQGIAKSVHDLSHRLHPSKLRLVGLVPAVQGLQRELTQPGLTITFTHEHVPAALDEDLTLCLFRIAQEAVQNAIKYSGGRHVSVDLRSNGENLTLTVADDGVGFDLASTWQKGLGLVSMRERLEAVGGSLEIRSRPGAGTRLQAAVPLRVRDAA